MRPVRVPEPKKFKSLSESAEEFALHRTLPEACHFIIALEKHQTEERTYFYYLYEEGFGCWIINLDGGIANYSDDPDLFPYQFTNERTVEDVVRRLAHERATIGFIGMDKESTTLLDEMRNREDFRDRTAKWSYDYFGLIILQPQEVRV